MKLIDGHCPTCGGSAVASEIKVLQDLLAAEQAENKRLREALAGIAACHVVDSATACMVGMANRALAPVEPAQCCASPGGTSNGCFPATLRDEGKEEP